MSQLIIQQQFGTNEIPLKVNLFVWRLLWNRLPTIDIDHLFLSCDVFGKIWLGIYNWLGLTIVHPEHVADHFNLNI